MPECKENVRQTHEISMLERYALRWSVLAAWADELRSRKIPVELSVGQKFEATRVKLASGCYSSCEVGSDLGYIEGVLVSCDASTSHTKVDFWLELLGRAMEDTGSIERLLKVPAVKFQLSSCGVNCKCAQ